MKIPIWVFLSDTDAGRQTELFTAVEPAHQRLYDAVFEDRMLTDPEDVKIRDEAQAALKSGQYEDLADAVSRFQEGSCDFYTVEWDAVEVASPFTSRELATILHGLRCAQQYTEPGCDHFADETPLTPEEIDSLCERINLGPKGELRIDGAE